MENLTLSKDLIGRYSAYWAELTEQSTEAINRILEFKESLIKEIEKSIETQNPLQEVDLGLGNEHRPIYVN